MADLSFKQRQEDFGLPEGGNRWALEAVRLLLNTPRAYEPLVLAWEQVYPGTVSALTRLVELEFAAYQGPVVIDTRTKDSAEASSPPVARYRLKVAGKKLLDAAESDERELTDLFPKLTDKNVEGVVELLRGLDVDPNAQKVGVSVAYLSQFSGLSLRTTHWWVAKLVERKYVRRLKNREADVREVIPAHYRPLRSLAKQLDEVIKYYFDGYEEEVMRKDLRLKRSKYPEDISPQRLGPGGATDFDHDVTSQKVVASMILSDKFDSHSRLSVEPRYQLGVDNGRIRRFTRNTTKGIRTYQPDAEFKVIDPRLGEFGAKAVVEYERYQSRRDGWYHMECFLGWVDLMSHVTEPAILFFVVDSSRRTESYRDLIRAFASHLEEHPEERVRNRSFLAVASVDNVMRVRDPLELTNWVSVELPKRPDTVNGGPVLYREDDSPYDRYFSQERRSK